MLVRATTVSARGVPLSTSLFIARNVHRKPSPPPPQSPFLKSVNISTIMVNILTIYHVIHTQTYQRNAT